MSEHLDPPTNWSGICRHLGPGIIITAGIVGSGELIVTPTLGAEVGFSLLWFVIFGCIIKVVVQIELGRYTVASGQTTLEAMDSVPGPRAVVSWLVWVCLLMFVALPFQVAGMLSGIAGIVTLAGVPERLEWLWVVAGAMITAGLLYSGRYRLVQNISMAMVIIFTLFTAFAVLAVQQTEFHITSQQIASGLSFQMPTSFTTAFAAFGIIGVGASELITYPYWCLEKGYARHVGTDDGSVAWLGRARGWGRVMSVDAWLSLIVYTAATVAFYLLGAAVLFGQGKQVSDENVIQHLSELYTKSYGSVGLAIFLLGGLCVLFSTVFAATASNARVFINGLDVYGIKTPRNEEERSRLIQLACVFLAMVPMVISLTIGKVIFLVFVGALAQGLMLPFLAIAALYFRLCRHRRVVQLPGKTWRFYVGTACLGCSTLCMTLVGLYQVWSKLFS